MPPLFPGQISTIFLSFMTWTDVLVLAATAPIDSNC